MDNSLTRYLLEHPEALTIERQDIAVSRAALEAVLGDWEFKEENITIPIKNEYAQPSIAFIDWLNFTFGREYYDTHPNTFIQSLSADLEDILGYGITEKRTRGFYFYKDSYVLGDESQAWGYVCIGSDDSQRNTILVVLTGAGCAAARPGWEEELYYWSQSLPRFRITRIDLAHDDFDGHYAVDKAVHDYDNGLFSLGARMPKIQQLGDWRNIFNMDGRSVYIGKRISGKLLRVYEKGKQLGQQLSPWVRIELELHSQDRLVPPDTLVYPGNYLAGAYPALFFLSQKQIRIHTLKKTRQSTYDKLIRVARQQFGRLIHYMSVVEPSAQHVIDMLAIPELPKTLVIPHFANSPAPIHGSDC